MPALDSAHALVVGIADYANIRKLPKVRDAEDLAAALGDPDLCGYDPKNVTLLLDPEATRANRAGLESLKSRCDADSTVFIYFSGHGGQIQPGPIGAIPAAHGHRHPGATGCPLRHLGAPNSPPP